MKCGLPPYTTRHRHKLDIENISSSSVSSFFCSAIFPMSSLVVRMPRLAVRLPQFSVRNVTLHRFRCYTSASPMPHFTLVQVWRFTHSSVALGTLECGIREGHLPASLSLPQRSTAVTAKYFFAVQKRTGAYVYSVPCTRWAIIFSGLEVSTG